jgi:hypothetical protein
VSESESCVRHIKKDVNNGRYVLCYVLYGLSPSLSHDFEHQIGCREWEVYVLLHIVYKV